MWEGKGEPFVPADGGSLPVAGCVLPGPPADHPRLLTGARHPVASALGRPTRYWLAVAETSPALREPSLLLMPGDMLLLECDPAWVSRPDLTDRRLCGVRLSGPGGSEYHLGRVLRQPEGLVVRLLGGVLAPALPPVAPQPTRKAATRRRRTIRPLDVEEAQARAREQSQEMRRNDAAAGLPIAQSDIVAVQVCLVRPELTGE